MQQWYPSYRKWMDTSQTYPTNQITWYDFAAGDCASIEGLVDSISQNAKPSPPEAGVYAVRSGPILFENISWFLKNKSPNEPPPYEPLLRFDPQEDFLKLIGCGDEIAIGFRWYLFLRGKWVWKLKDAIDTTFMDLFKVSKPRTTKQHPTTTNHRIGTHTSHQTPIHQIILLVEGRHAHL